MAIEFGSVQKNVAAGLHLWCVVLYTAQKKTKTTKHKPETIVRTQF